MKKFLALLTIAFMVPLVSFNANANTPSYDDIGIYEVPIIATDNVTVGDYSPAILSERCDYAIYYIEIAVCNIDVINLNCIYIQKTSIGGLLLFSNKITAENNHTKLTMLYSSVLPYYMCKILSDNKRTKQRQTHDRYKKRTNYTKLGYSLWN